MAAHRRINRKETRSLFREAIPIPNIAFGALKIKVPVLVRRPDKSVTRFALSRSIMNSFLSCCRRNKSCRRMQVCFQLKHLGDLLAFL